MNRPIYNFDYSFQANWQPIYVLGTKFPVEVKLLNAQESISFDMDIYRNVLFSGENVYGNLLTGTNENLQFKNLSLICQDRCSESSDSLNLNISGFKIKSVNPNVQVGEFVRVNYIANKYY